jgi:hypothetical protein
MPLRWLKFLIFFRNGKLTEDSVQTRGLKYHFSFTEENNITRDRLVVHSLLVGKRAENCIWHVGYVTKQAVISVYVNQRRVATFTGTIVQHAFLPTAQT